MVDGQGHHIQSCSNYRVSTPSSKVVFSYVNSIFLCYYFSILFPLITGRVARRQKLYPLRFWILFSVRNLSIVFRSHFSKIQRRQIERLRHSSYPSIFQFFLRHVLKTLLCCSCLTNCSSTPPPMPPWFKAYNYVYILSYSAVRSGENHR